MIKVTNKKNNNSVTFVTFLNRVTGKQDTRNELFALVTANCLL